MTVFTVARHLALQRSFDLVRVVKTVPRCIVAVLNRSAGRLFQVVAEVCIVVDASNFCIHG